jgi:hypothetical protein
VALKSPKLKRIAERNIEIIALLLILVPRSPSVKVPHGGPIWLAVVPANMSAGFTLPTTFQADLINIAQGSLCATSQSCSAMRLGVRLLATALA